MRPHSEKEAGAEVETTRDKLEGEIQAPEWRHRREVRAGCRLIFTMPTNLETKGPTSKWPRTVHSHRFWTWVWILLVGARREWHCHRKCSAELWRVWSNHEPKASEWKIPSISDIICSRSGSWASLERNCWNSLAWSVSSTADGEGEGIIMWTILSGLFSTITSGCGRLSSSTHLRRHCKSCPRPSPCV